MFVELLKGLVVEPSRMSLQYASDSCELGEANRVVSGFRGLSYC